MNKKYRLVIFDWEGTLSDHLGLILHCLSTEAARLNYGKLDEARAREAVEFGLVNALKRLFPNLTNIQYEHLLAAIQQSLLEKHAEIFLIPGAKDLIMQLKKAGIFLAIASNKGPQGLQRALQTTGMDAYFPVVRSAGPLPPKPSTAMLEDILSAFSVSREEALMVGDSLTDIEMAVNAQVDVVGMDFYHLHGPLLKKAGALHIFDSYSLLANFLQLPPEESSL